LRASDCRNERVLKRSTRESLPLDEHKTIFPTSRLRMVGSNMATRSQQLNLTVDTDVAHLEMLPDYVQVGKHSLRVSKVFWTYWRFAVERQATFLRRLITFNHGRSIRSSKRSSYECVPCFGSSQSVSHSEVANCGDKR